MPNFIKSYKKDDELYLTAKVCNEPKDFKLKLISKIEIQEENFQSEKNFPLQRHMNIHSPNNFKDNLILQLSRALETL